MTQDNVIYYIITIFVICWIYSSIYVMKWHMKQDNLDIGTFLVALLLGPILSIIIYDSEKDERQRKREERERETGDRHRRWFRTMGEINRNAIPDYGRTIPPPPPISRVDRARSERDEAIRMARERLEPPNRRPDIKLKGFKFFH